MGDFWVDERKGESPIRTWDKLILGGVTWPGICTIEPGVTLGVDVVKLITNINAISETSPPIYKARLSDKGYNPATARALVAVWEKDQWEDLEETAAKFSPKQTSKIRDAYDILHPSTAVLGIDSVIITGLRLRHPVNQTLVCEIELLQWFPSMPFKKVRPNGGALNDGDFKVSAPNAAANNGG